MITTRPHAHVLFTSVLRKRTKFQLCRWVQPPAAVVEHGIDAMLGYLRRIWGSATSLVLDLSSTGATYFPPEVFEKRFSRLTEINLSHCNVQELPLGLTMFTNLRSHPRSMLMLRAVK